MWIVLGIFIFWCLVFILTSIRERRIRIRLLRNKENSLFLRDFAESISHNVSSETLEKLVKFKASRFINDDDDDDDDDEDEDLENLKEKTDD